MMRNKVCTTPCLRLMQALDRSMYVTYGVQPPRFPGSSINEASFVCRFANLRNRQLA